MAQRPKFRRKRYLIKKGLQFRFIGVIFLLALLTSIVTGWTVFTTGWGLLGEKLADVYPQGRLLYVLRTTNLALVKNLLFVSPFIFLLGLLFSHKIAGPVYRIEKAIYEIANGNLALKIKLRRGDELRDIAALLNDMTENLSNSIVLNKDIVMQIQKELDGIKKMLSSQSHDTSSVGPSLNNIEKKIEDLNSSLNRWTTAA